MKKTTIKKSISAIAAISLVGTTANAALWVSESFDYAGGTVNGTQAGGTGLSGAWSGSTTNIPYSIDASNPIDVSGITGLSASGPKLQRNSAPGAAEISRGLDAAAVTNLTADGSTIYFSIILENNRFSTGNANDSFIISTGAVPIASAGDNPINIAGEEGFGVSFNGFGASPSGSIDIYGLAIDGGVGAHTSGFIDTGITGNTADGGEAFFIVGQIDWNANGTNDVLTLYNVTDASTLPTAFATIEADIDNSNISTLAFAGEQIGAFDEIRIGNSLSDVSAIPEPSSTALLGLGGLALLLRRRR